MLADIADFLPILIFVGIGVVVVIGIFFSIFYEKKRKEKLVEMANELGLQFFAGQDGWFGKSSSAIPVDQELLTFTLCSQGRGRRIRNMIYGETAGTELAIFDYQYTVGSGKQSRTYRQTVMYMRSQEVRLPQFMARPESFFDKFSDMFGFKDINFEEHPEFSKAFRLTGENEAAIRQLFQQELLDYFVQHRDMTVEAQFNQMIFYRPQKRLKPEQIRDFMKDGFEVFANLQQAVGDIPKA